MWLIKRAKHQATGEHFYVAALLLIWGIKWLLINPFGGFCKPFNLVELSPPVTMNFSIFSSVGLSLQNYDFEQVLWASDTISSWTNKWLTIIRTSHVGMLHHSMSANSESDRTKIWLTSSLSAISTEKSSPL